jgi:hypothetical protein
MAKLTPKQRLATVRLIRKEAKLTTGFDPKGGHWKKVLAGLSKLERDVLPPPVPKVPQLGPVIKGGRSILLEDCTHKTSGIPYYSAFDTGFDRAGLEVVAPESLTITDDTSSSQGGDAFYAVGASGLKYWFGHIGHVPKQGTKFRKGAVITKIADQSGTDHLHLGIDARPLIGKALLYGSTGTGPDYTHGSPDIGRQLAKK